MRVVPSAIGAVALSAIGLGVAVGGCRTDAGGQTLPQHDAPPIQLAVLHTNDNWGETRPCG